MDCAASGIRAVPLSPRGFHRHLRPFFGHPQGWTKKYIPPTYVPFSLFWTQQKRGGGVEGNIPFKIQVLILIAHYSAKYRSFSILQFSAACGQEHGASFELLHVPISSDYIMPQHCE